MTVCLAVPLALVAGVLLGRLTAPPPGCRWVVVRDRGRRMVRWSDPRPDGRYRWASHPYISPDLLAAELNSRGVTPATLDPFVTAAPAAGGGR